MKKSYILIIVSCFIQLGCKAQVQKINGVSFVASRDSIDQSHLQPVLNIKSNYVALMPFGFIRDLKTPKIRYNSDRQWFGETENGLIQYAKEFQNHQVHIMVKPQIWVWRGQFTGKIAMGTEEDWNTLEDTYSEFILTYAKAAQQVHADIFCIGTELEQFVLNRPKFWQQLIKDIKKVFRGKLTYAANWDEYKKLTFWSDLDFIGIDAYFPLSDEKTPSVIDLQNGWKSHKTIIKSVQERFQKPILFTEYGYRSIDFTAKQPWQMDRVDGNINLQAQVNALQAIHKEFWDENWFAGGFLWKWFHKHKQVGGKNNNRFTPQNKPAEVLIKALHQQKDY